jgi:hypothetical protein
MTDEARARTEIRAAQLFDLLQDELRVFQPSIAEAEIALCNLLGSYLSGTTNSDSEASNIISRIGERIAHAYETCKRVEKRNHEMDRMIYKIN